MNDKTRKALGQWHKQKFRTRIAPWYGEVRADERYNGFVAGIEHQQKKIDDTLAEYNAFLLSKYRLQLKEHLAEFLALKEQKQ